MASTHSNLDPAQADLKALKGKIPLIGLTGGIGSGKTTVSDLLGELGACLLYTSPSPRDAHESRMPSSA